MASTSAFDDLIHQLMSATRRPKTSEDVEALKELLAKIVDLCETDASRWTKFVLAVVYKRYHDKSPQAKAEAATKKGDRNAAIETGDGERRIFYETVEHLFGYVREEEVAEKRAAAARALSCLIEIAPEAGGSRDVCAIIESLVGEAIKEDLDEKREKMELLFGEESLSFLVALGVKTINQLEGEAGGVLQKVLHFAAHVLDHDFEVIEGQKNGKQAAAASLDGEENEIGAKNLPRELPSTLHIFIPHRDRGKPASPNKKRRAEELAPTTAKQKAFKVPHRQVTNAVSEVLIWSKTSRLMSRKSFESAHNTLVQASSLPMSGEAKTMVKASLHKMQTIIRKERQVLNSFARDAGFMLNDLLKQKPEAITYSQIRHGKSGDLAMLSRLAKKFKTEAAARVLQLVAFRYASDPSKINRFESVSDLKTCWKLPPAAENDTDEIAKVEHEIYAARLKATVTSLRALATNSEAGTLVACLDNSQMSQIAALLAAAAFGEWDVDGGDVVTDEGKCKLRLGGTNQDVRSMSDFVSLLNTLVGGTLVVEEADAPSFAAADGTATTKAVMNLIDRHLQPGQALILFTEKDIQLPDVFMKDLISKNCSIHCHDADGLGARLARENARRGDITISLAWNTHEDLDLHCRIPSNEEIFYGKKASKDGKVMLDVDMNASSPYSKEPVENIFVGNLDEMVEAPKGTYTVVVQNFAYHTKDSNKTTPVPWTVVVDKNGKKETFYGECVGTGKSSDRIVCEFVYEGRQIPFPAQEAAKTAFGTSNLVNITASTGATMETLGNVVQVPRQHEHMDVVRQLVHEDENDGAAAPVAPADEDGDAVMESTEEGEQANEDIDTATATTPEQVVESSVDAGEQRPVVSLDGKFEVTSRDRSNMLLFKLPSRFHEIVSDEIGGPTLAQSCAVSIAKQMVEDKIPIKELRKSGYPSDIVSSVKTMMVKMAPLSS